MREISNMVAPTISFDWFLNKNATEENEYKNKVKNVAKYLNIGGMFQIKDG